MLCILIISIDHTYIYDTNYFTKYINFEYNVKYNIISLNENNTLYYYFSMNILCIFVDTRT